MRHQSACRSSFFPKSPSYLTSFKEWSHSWPWEDHSNKSWRSQHTTSAKSKYEIVRPANQARLNAWAVQRNSIMVMNRPLWQIMTYCQQCGPYSDTAGHAPNVFRWAPPPVLTTEVGPAWWLMSGQGVAKILFIIGSVSLYGSSPRTFYSNEHEAPNNLAPRVYGTLLLASRYSVSSTKWEMRKL